MAIAFFHFKHISRGNGQSVVAASAYRAGEKLWDESREEWHDYTKKEVAHTEMLVCAQAPSWASDRDRLWNEVERVEKRSDARLARDGVLALPNQLSLEQNLGLVQGFLTRQFVERGMVVDVPKPPKPLQGLKLFTSNVPQDVTCDTFQNPQNPYRD